MHKIHWAVPAPRWVAAAAIANLTGRRAAMRKPMILRFATDGFMPELAAVLDDDPERLVELEARPGETWRDQPDAITLPDDDATRLSTGVRRSMGARFKLTAAGRALEPSAAIRQLRARNEKAKAERDRKRRESDKKPAAPVLKLYQPAHQRYYLVAASLVCRFPGLPDHKVDPAKQERVSFVIRRLVPKDRDATEFVPDQCVEHAFVTTAGGPAWVAVPSGDPLEPALVPGEERLPMFGTPYIGRDGVPRRLVTGLVPVSRRETYVGAPEEPAPAHSPVPAPSSTEANSKKGADADESETDDSVAYAEPTDPRAILLINDVIGPWRALAAEARKLQKETLKGVPSDKREEAQTHALQVREQLVLSSWYILLDLSAFLDKYLPNVFVAIQNDTDRDLERGQEKALFTALNKVAYETDTDTVTLASALRSIEQYREKLEDAPTRYTEETRDSFKGLPRFSFAAIGLPSPKFDLGFADSMTGPGPNKINGLIANALDPNDPTPAPPPPTAAKLPMPVNAATRFVIRCVFDRPLCGIAPPTVSDKTEPFVMAAFFDPDAPARPVRISLPADTSPAGLRKYQKNAAFLMSDVLCGQINGMRKLTLGDLVLSVLPWPFHKNLPDPGPMQPCTSGPSGPQLGMVCSLSIPIVTICALILLIIIVSILDYFFRWMPYLMTCFPLPFKAKEQA